MWQNSHISRTFLCSLFICFVNREIVEGRVKSKTIPTRYVVCVGRLESRKDGEIAYPLGVQLRYANKTEPTTARRHVSQILHPPFWERQNSDRGATSWPIIFRGTFKLQASWTILRKVMSSLSPKFNLRNAGLYPQSCKCRRRPWGHKLVGYVVEKLACTEIFHVTSSQIRLYIVQTVTTTSLVKIHRYVQQSHCYWRTNTPPWCSICRFMGELSEGQWGLDPRPPSSFRWS